MSVFTSLLCSYNPFHIILSTVGVEMNQIALLERDIWCIFCKMYPICRVPLRRQTPGSRAPLQVLMRPRNESWVSSAGLSDDNQSRSGKKKTSKVIRSTRPAHSNEGRVYGRTQTRLKNYKQNISFHHVGKKNICKMFYLWRFLNSNSFYYWDVTDLQTHTSLLIH